jgi:hypothetical protein
MPARETISAMMNPETADGAEGGRHSAKRGGGGASGGGVASGNSLE